MSALTRPWRGILYSAFVWMLTFGAVGFSSGVLAESSIVILGAQTKVQHKQFVEGFKQYLNEHEKDLKFADIAMGDDAGTGSDLKEIIQRNNVPLILTMGPEAFQSAVLNDLNRPLIAGLTEDASLLEKNANATGVILDHKVETQMLWIKRLLPDAVTVGVLYNPAESGTKISAAKKAADKLGLKLIAHEVDSPKELPVAMESLFRRIDVLWGIDDPVVLSRQTAKAILLTSFRNNVPFIAPSPAWVKAGALYSLEFDYVDLGAQTGEIAGNVLRGKKASAIPPQEPRVVRYTLNRRTAEHMRLTLSGQIFSGAAQVFE